MPQQALLTTSQAMMPWYHPATVPYPTFWMTSIWSQYAIAATPQTADTFDKCHPMSRGVDSRCYPTLRITSMKPRFTWQGLSNYPDWQCSKPSLRLFGGPIPLVKRRHELFELQLINIPWQYFDTRLLLIKGFETFNLTLHATSVAVPIHDLSHVACPCYRPSPQYNPTISLPLSTPSPDSLLPPQYHMNDLSFTPRNTNTAKHSLLRPPLHNRFPLHRVHKDCELHPSEPTRYSLSTTRAQPSLPLCEAKHPLSLGIKLRADRCVRASLHGRGFIWSGLK